MWTKFESLTSSQRESLDMEQEDFETEDSVSSSQISESQHHKASLSQKSYLDKLERFSQGSSDSFLYKDKNEQQLSILNSIDDEQQLAVSPPFENDDNFSIALTGHAFNHIFTQYSQINQKHSKKQKDKKTAIYEKPKLEDKKKGEKSYSEVCNDDELSLYYKRIIEKTKVYARMAPEDKGRLMECLSEYGIVCMCGDGANDCAALKNAGVGISLTQAEASIAAPFTSQIQDISCVPKILREGRAALVTSFTSFKYMALYSVIQFTGATLLYLKGVNYTDLMFLYIDLLTITPLTFTMNW